MTIEKLIELFLKAGYDDKKAGGHALADFKPIYFFELCRKELKDADTQKHAV